MNVAQDYAAMTEQGCVDLWLDMAYCWCVSYEAHSDTRNRAPTPLPFVDDIINTYGEHEQQPLPSDNAE